MMVTRLWSWRQGVRSAASSWFRTKRERNPARVRSKQADPTGADPVRHRSGRVPDRSTAVDSLTSRRRVGFRLGRRAAAEVDPTLGPVRVLNGDVEAEAPVRALGATACHGSSGLTTEGLKIKAGDHPGRDVARSDP